MTNKKKKYYSEGKKRKIFLLASTVFFLSMVTVSFFRDKGFLKVLEIRKEIQDLEKKITLLGVKNRRLETEVITLRTDNASFVERVAREELGMVKPGEVVFEFITGQNKMSGINN